MVYHLLLYYNIPLHQLTELSSVDSYQSRLVCNIVTPSTVSEHAQHNLAHHQCAPVIIISSHRPFIIINFAYHHSHKYIH